jgi:hypothetical protein
MNKSKGMAADSQLQPFSRRALLAGAMASACGRRRGTRYQGWLFVASGGEKEIAVADLASFRRVATIPLPCGPDQLFQSRDRVFALCRDEQAVVEIDVERFRFAGRIGLPGKPIAASLLPDAATAIILTDEPAALLRVDLVNRRVTARLQLPGPPRDMDLNGISAAITVPAKNAVLRVALSGLNAPNLGLTGSTDTGVPCGTVRFRRDGKTILAGATAAREIVAIDAQSGKLLARLPLPLSPSRFCFNPDGGQMFVTGTSEDALAIVSPFQNEVAETILAGRTPYAMAVSERRSDDSQYRNSRRLRFRAYRRNPRGYFAYSGWGVRPRYRPPFRQRIGSADIHCPRSQGEDEAPLHGVSDRSRCTFGPHCSFPELIPKSSAIEDHDVDAPVMRPPLG